MAGLAVTEKSAFLMRQDARDMPENKKAGVYAPAFCFCEEFFRKIPLVRRWEGAAEAGKEGCRPGCSLLKKVFQCFALQAVPLDIFLVIFAKSLGGKKEDVLRLAGRMAFIQQGVAGKKMQFVDDFDFFIISNGIIKKERIFTIC